MIRPRSLFSIILPLLATTAMGQGWEYQFERAGRATYFPDAVEVNGTWLIIGNSVTLAGTTTDELRMIRIDEDGLELERRLLWGQDSDASGATACFDQNSGSVHLLGTFEDGSGGNFFQHYLTNASGEALDSTLVNIPGVVRISMNNACMASNGDLIVAIIASATANAPSDTGILLRISSSGDSLDAVRLMSPNTILMRDIIEEGIDTFLVACYGGPHYVNDGYGLCSYLRFNGELDTMGYFTGIPLEGIGTPPWNVVDDHQHLLRLSSGNLFIGGRMIPRAVLQKVTPTGEHLGVFAPESGLPYDFPGFYASIDTTAEGHLLFAYMANFQPGPPTALQPSEPGRIHIYELDTSLNVICTNTVDGFPDDAFYWLNRIKATSDGGYVLIGGRVDTSLPDAGMVGWIRKFDAEDCYSDIGIKLVPRAMTVFPNPAGNEVNFTVNGTTRNGRIDLYDTEGRALWSIPLRNNRGNADVRRFASGMYGYRVFDVDGEMITSGRWIKE